MIKKHTLKLLIPPTLLCCTLQVGAETFEKKDSVRPNIVLFTADDLGWFSLGCYGATTDVTPNLDTFAKEGIRFEHGYVNAAISAPSRRIICTGMYGHNTGAMGFNPVDRTRDIPILPDLLREAGYGTGILGKVEHSSPYENYQWDFSYDYDDLGCGRDPKLYAKYFEEYVTKCMKENKPFYFMVNSHDPHRPFHDPENPKSYGTGAIPTRLFSPDEIDIPPYLPDLPEIRRELSHYFNSTRRLDDTFGAVIKTLDKLKCRNNTIVIFISDNGIAVPFAKANVYYASNRTPFLVRWPGVIKPNQINDTDLVSTVDFLATFLDIARLPVPKQTDGKSFKDVLLGKAKKHNEMVYNQIDSKISGPPVPMRSVITRDYCYIFNPWHDGKRVYRNNNEGESLAGIKELSKTDVEAASRLKLYRKRVPTELYDLRKDPGALHNLVDSTEYSSILKMMENLMLQQMITSKDVLLETFKARNDQKAKERELLKTYPTISNEDLQKHELLYVYPELNKSYGK